MRCSNCGQENEKDNTLCRFCGSPFASLFEDAAGSNNAGVADTDEGYHSAPGYGAYKAETYTVKTKISIIISVLVVLLLLSFVLLIYRRITSEDKDASGIFYEETKQDAPLLLPGFKTDPTQVLTDPMTSVSSYTGTQVEETQPSVTSAPAITTEPETSIPPSIRVIVNTDCETETSDTTASVTHTADVSEDNTNTEADATVSEAGRSENTASLTTVTTTSAKATTTTEVTTTSSKSPVRVHIIPDPQEFPVIRLYYNIDVEECNNSKPRIDPDQLQLRIFESLDNEDDDGWVEQIQLFMKKNSNITLVANFAQTFESGDYINSSLLDFIKIMNLSKNQQELKDTDNKDQSEEASTWDIFSLITYGSDIEVKVAHTSSYDNARAAIDDSTATSGADILLHNAIYTAINNAANEQYDHASVVIITDGRYTDENTLSDMEQLAKEKSIPVHIAYISDGTDLETTKTSEAPGRHSAGTMKNFAVETRGTFRSFVGSSKDWEKHLVAALSSTLTCEREDTFLTYKSSFYPDSKAKTVHHVRLELYYKGEDGESVRVISDPSRYDVPTD